MDARFGLLCFSEVWDSILLWSHYAEKHAGIVLGFDVSADRSRFLPVDYVSLREIVRAPTVGFVAAR